MPTLRTGGRAGSSSVACSSCWRSSARGSRTRRVTACNRGRAFALTGGPLHTRDRDLERDPDRDLERDPERDPERDLERDPEPGPEPEHDPEHDPERDPEREPERDLDAEHGHDPEPWVSTK